jgi:hypothetical protein
MIVTYKPFGRLGNRLFLFAHLIAFSDRYSTDIINYTFREYRNYFPYWHDGARCEYGKLSNGKESLLSSYAIIKLAGVIGAIPTVRFWDERDIIFDGEDSADPRIEQLLHSPLSIFEGWRFRSHGQILSSIRIIRSVFAPREDILESVANRIVKARGRGDKVLGVHIRWEDYRGTDKYFTLREFKEYIRYVRFSLGSAKVVCIISSPEKFDQTELPENCIALGQGDPVGDLYTLAECDYILGPPSTFSGWASFYGGKPLFVMTEHGKKVGLEDAKVVRW